METNDLVTKNFETYPDIAADILNALLYEGKQEIRKRIFWHLRQKLCIREKQSCGTSWRISPSTIWQTVR